MLRRNLLFEKLPLKYYTEPTVRKSHREHTLKNKNLRLLKLVKHNNQLSTGSHR